MRALIIYGEDEAQIARNYLAREGDPQPVRARPSWRHSEWQRAEAERLALPAVAARPWDTVLERALAAIGGEIGPRIAPFYAGYGCHRLPLRPRGPWRLVQEANE